MPFLPSYTLILTHSLTCLTISFILSTNPSLVTSSAPIWLIGEAMHIRETPTFSLPSEPLAALALILAVLAFVESVFAGTLAAASTSAKKGGEAAQSLQAFAEKAAVLHNAQAQWMMISSAKALGFGLLVMYSYLTTGRGEGVRYVVPLGLGTGRWGLGMLNNRVAFVGAFAEMLFWGYLWTNLKDEERELASRIKVKREEIREKGDGDWD